MSTEEIESVQETGKSTGVDVTHNLTAAALIQLGKQEALSVGPRPTFRSPSLRTDELGRPSVSLAPGNLEALEGYDSDKESVSEAVTAMSELQQGVQKIIDAREASKRNPAWTEATQIIMTANLADKVSANVTPKVDAALRLLGARITDTESKLKQPLDAGVATPVATEVRDHIRGLTVMKRNELVLSLIEKGDTRTLGALLGSGVPAFLSGLTDEQVTVYTEMHNRKRSPQLAQKLTLLRAAHQKLSDAGSLFIVQAERAQGVNASVVAKLKLAQSKAEAAFR